MRNEEIVYRELWRTSNVKRRRTKIMNKLLDSVDILVGILLLGVIYFVVDTYAHWAHRLDCDGPRTGSCDWTCCRYHHSGN